jgi:hypothetical protein
MPPTANRNNASRSRYRSQLALHRLLNDITDDDDDDDDDDDEPNNDANGIDVIDRSLTSSSMRTVLCDRSFSIDQNHHSHEPRYSPDLLCARSCVT